MIDKYKRFEHAYHSESTPKFAFFIRMVLCCYLPVSPRECLRGNLARLATFIQEYPGVTTKDNLDLIRKEYDFRYKSFNLSLTVIQPEMDNNTKIFGTNTST